MAQRLLRATTTLVLTAWTLPSIAATSTDTRSDQAMDAPPLSLSADRKLPMRVIDHGAVRAAAPDSLPLGDAATEAAPDATQPPKGPRVDIMLRRIFDEAQARQPQLHEPQEEDDFNAPLAVDKSEPLEDPPRLLEGDPAEAAAEFPGIGADEFLRYRQQMYRTDI